MWAGNANAIMLSLLTTLGPLSHSLRAVLAMHHYFAEIASDQPNNRARNGYFAEIASDQPNNRARNGYFAEIASDQPNNRARNGYFAEIASDQPNNRVRNGYFAERNEQEYVGTCQFTAVVIESI